MLELPWPVWLAAGLVIMGLEIIMPGLVVFWFGAGAVITAILTWAGLLTDAFAQWVCFLASSLVFLGCWFLVFKRFFPERGMGNARDPTLLTLRGKVLQRIEPGTPGKVELYDFFHGLKFWKAESDTIIEAGEEIRVIESRGINLIVEKTDIKESLL
jgi:hypothetical protein